MPPRGNLPRILRVVSFDEREYFLYAYIDARGYGGQLADESLNDRLAALEYVCIDPNPEKFFVLEFTSLGVTSMTEQHLLSNRAQWVRRGEFVSAYGCRCESPPRQRQVI